MLETTPQKPKLEINNKKIVLSNLKIDQIIKKRENQIIYAWGFFLHKILGKVLLINSLDVSTLFVNQNMSYL